MPPLADIQAAFAAAILDPERAPPDALRTIDGHGPSRRFGVYRNNVVVGLIDALAATYPVVAKLVGDEFFRQMARAFVRAHPPRSPVLIEYGGGFAGFIEDFPPARSVPYLADMARLEWAWTQAYNAADRTPIPISALAEIPADQVAGTVFDFHPSLHLIRSRWPLASLFAACKDESASGEVEMTRPESVLVIRPHFDVSVRTVSDGSAAFLTSLRDGLSLEAAFTSAETPEFDLSTQLAALFDVGAVIGLDHETTGGDDDPKTD